jgi:hypothetical protein
MAPGGSRSTRNTPGDTPTDSSGTLGGQPSQGSTSIGLADKLAAAQRRIAELEEEVRIRAELEINRQGNIPTSRERLIAAAVRVENHLSLFSGKQGRHEETSGHRKHKGAGSDKGEHRQKRGRSRSL